MYSNNKLDLQSIYLLNLGFNIATTTLDNIPCLFK